MKPALTACLLVLALAAPASASPIYLYDFSFSNGTDSAAGVITISPYDFPAGSVSNAVLTSISFTDLSPHVAHVMFTEIGLNLPTFTCCLGYGDAFTVSPTGDLLAGGFDWFSSCDFNCVHISFDTTGGSLFLDAPDLSGPPGNPGDQVFLGGSITRPAAAVPEPGPLMLFGIGLLGVAIRLRVRRPALVPLVQRERTDR